MVVLESFSPVIKFLREYMVDRSGVPPNFKEYYFSESNGNQRFLIPVGSEEFDLYIVSQVPLITGRESNQDLRALAERVPLTIQEHRAPWTIKNRTYIFIADVIQAKFVRGRHLFAGAGTSLSYWFFAKSRPQDQIIADIRGLAGRHYSRRAERITETVKKRGYVPYKGLAAVVEFFTRISDHLVKYTRKRIKLLEDLQEAVPRSESKPGPHVLELVRGTLQFCKQYLPKMYSDLRSIAAINYPDLVLVGPGPGRPLEESGGVI